jgi:hypothetical protein
MTTDPKTKKAELVLEVQQFKSKKAYAPPPQEREIQRHIDGLEKEIAASSEALAASFSAGDTESLATARARIKIAEESLEDFQRILQSGNLRRQHNEEVAAEADRLQAAAYALGLEFKEAHAKKMAAVFEARTAFLQALSDCADCSREAANMAAMVDELSRWSGRAWNRSPGGLRPQPANSWLYKLRVDDGDLGHAWVSDGHWYF